MREQKRQIRRSMLTARRGLSEEERNARSLWVWERLRALPCYQRAQVMLCYMSFDKEVLTEGLIRQAIVTGKRVVLPVVQAHHHTLALYEISHVEHDVAPGYGGILEPRPEHRRPVAAGELDLVMVPGVAFDVQGTRLGFGKGFYDRLLQEIPCDVPKLGVAFDFQVVPQLPRQPHDITMDGIVTESRVLWCGPSGQGREPR
ncbi:MAG: 5-formyltetrahydrofolate cyclo-ligase [Nitrospinae bacterium]|nr:5-formyltetrahydrofolate cyclo-ligase [Nitrospinota bacterium]